MNEKDINKPQLNYWKNKRLTDRTNSIISEFRTISSKSTLYFLQDRLYHHDIPLKFSAGENKVKRDLNIWLKAWKRDRKRKPLIIRGARQVGKTWTVTNFGKSDFRQLVEINFELQPQFKSVFSNLDPHEIVQKIELTENIEIDPGTTLLFLDEIQECPQALKALRYFYEKMPQLHVIAAGSLLEFIMESEAISIPVGRVQDIHMVPLSFGEFLTVVGEPKLRSYLQNLTLDSTIPEPVQAKCLSLLKTYLYLGGMPEAVADWLEFNKFNKTDALHKGLLLNYRNDFGKYGKRVNTEMLEKVFVKSPAMVGVKFKYSAIDNQSNSRDIRKALQMLVKAHVVYKVHSVPGSGLPLHAHVNEKSFRILFLDVGLMQAAMGINRDTYLSDNLLAVYRGMVAEQFVGQQLLALKQPFEEPELYYWHRETRGSAAEVDYLRQSGEHILPVEVKAGKTGSLKSLKLFLAEKKAPFGVRFSLHPLAFSDSVLSIPLYAIEATPGLIKRSLEVI